MLHISCNNHERHTVCAEYIFNFDMNWKKARTFRKIMISLLFKCMRHTEWIENVISHFDTVDLHVQT